MDFKKLRRWQRDPIAFITQVLVNPETGKPFELYEAEAQFLRAALTPSADGRLPYPELVYGAPKKSGKTALAALAGLYLVVCLGGQYAEAYCVANDFEQAQGRVFTAISRIIEASPMLRASARLAASRIEFTSTGSSITALASDYASAAGANPNLTIFDELWAYTSERAHRLWDEMVPVPTRKVSARLTVTYAGFEGESDLLESLYKRAMGGETTAADLYVNGSLLCYWTHDCPAPWQTPEWRQQMREQLRPNAYLRLIENRWVSSESSFVEMDWFDECVSPELRPVLNDSDLQVWVGVDASVKRDSTAIVAATFDERMKRVRLVWHRIFQPSAKNPLDFEATIEASLLELNRRFEVREIRFDPWQMQAVSQRLQKAGLPMVEFPQSVPNLTEASSNLYELIKSRNLSLYPDADIRLAMSRAIAVETSRGWRIAKEKASHKIDVIVALAQACLGAVQFGQEGEPGIIGFYRAQAAKAELAELRKVSPAMNDEERRSMVAKQYGMAPAEFDELIDEDGINDIAEAYERELRLFDNRNTHCPGCGNKLGGSRTSAGNGDYCSMECLEWAQRC